MAKVVQLTGRIGIRTKAAARLSVSLGRDVRTFVLDAINASLGGDQGGDVGASETRAARGEFMRSFDGLERDPKIDEANRDIIRKAIFYAVLASSPAVNNELARHLDERWRNSQTRAARDPRRADELQRIVEEEARALWGRRPELRDKLSQAASAILPTVMRRVAAMEKIPRGRAPTGLPNERNLQVERIRKRLKRTGESDD